MRKNKGNACMKVTNKEPVMVPNKNDSLDKKKAPPTKGRADEIKPHPIIPVKVNIYQELASLPSDLADKITNAKTSGGRSLNAIHESHLKQIEKHLLLVLGSELNFCKDFANQYRFISLNSLAEKLSIDKRTVSSILNGMVRKGQKVPGLIDKGYVNKKAVSKEDQMKGWANHYCITTKIFDEYMMKLIDQYKKALNLKDNSDSVSGGGSDPGSLPYGSTITTPSDPGSHKVPVFNAPKKAPSLNADQQPAKRVRPKTGKIKPWEEKSEEQKMDTLLNMTCDSHRLGTQQDKRIKPFPFDDVPDLLLPILKHHGLEKVKEFLEQGRTERKGYNVRLLGAEILKWMDNKLDESKPILVKDERQEEKFQIKENNFPQNVVEQVGRNMNIEFKEKTTDEILSTLPIEFKDFVNNLKPMQKKAFAKDLNAMKNDEIRTAYLNSIFIKKIKIDPMDDDKRSISIGMA